MIINGLYKKSGGGGQTPATGFVPTSWNSNGQVLTGEWYGSRIGEYFFRSENNAQGQYNALKTVTFNGTLTQIDRLAFTGCGALSISGLPSTVTSIAQNAFGYCQSLEWTSLPSSLVSLGTFAFQYCNKLALTSLPNGLTSIQASAFKGCPKITIATLPDGITSIGEQAFESCTLLALTALPANLSGKIGRNAFRFCPAISVRTIPSGVTEIDNQAFYGCTGITSITQAGLNQAQSNYYSSVFQGCTNLATADLNSPGQLYSSYFSGCSSLSTLVIRANSLCTLYGTNVFTGTPIAAGRGTIYVPQALVETYKTATNWSTLYAAGTQILPIEGSQYETHYADGSAV